MPGFYSRIEANAASNGSNEREMNLASCFKVYLNKKNFEIAFGASEKIDAFHRSAQFSILSNFANFKVSYSVVNRVLKSWSWSEYGIEN